MQLLKTPLYALLSVFIISPVWADDEVLPVQKQGNVSFVTGGVGQEESDALASVQNHYNLRITTTDKTGHYLMDTHLVITDSEHRAILDTTGGPFFYVQLPNGHYDVQAGQGKAQAVTIAGGRSARMHFTR